MRERRIKRVKIGAFILFQKELCLCVFSKSKTFWNIYSFTNPCYEVFNPDFKIKIVKKIRNEKQFEFYLKAFRAEKEIFKKTLQKIKK